jgi:2-haloacid dehalogenase
VQPGRGWCDILRSSKTRAAGHASNDHDHRNPRGLERLVSKPLRPEPLVAAVVFDLGGVLIDWNPRHLYRKLFPGDEAAMEHFLTTVCTPAWNLEQDRGRSLQEATTLLQATHPEQAELIAAYYGRWPEMLDGAIPGSVALLEELVAAGIPVYALTNWSAETFPYARPRFPFLDLFRGIIVSGEEGLVKPDARLFGRAAERFGLEPSRTLFIDDAAHNVAGAELAGFRGALFTTPEALHRELQAFGLLVERTAAPDGAPSRRQ